MIAPQTAGRKTETLGRAKRKGVGGKEFLPALAFRRRRISYFALRNAPPEIACRNLFYLVVLKWK